MKKYLSLLLALIMAFSMTVVFTGCGDSGEAESEDTAKAEEPATLDEALTNVVNRDDGTSLAGFAVEAIKDNEVVYKFADGYRYIDNENEDNNLPMQTDTKIRIASVSKTFVAVAIMQLVEKGQIDLDADISDYLGFELRNPNFPDTAITCRMLMSHTSSLRDGDLYSIAPEYTLEEFFVEGGKYYEKGAHFAGKKQAPGEYFSYCNLNYGVLGTIIEAVSGERFDKYMTAHVLEPMGFDASFNVSDFDEEQIDNLAAIYQKEYKKDGYAKEGSGWIAQVDDYKGETVEPNTTMLSNPDTESGFEFVSLDDYEIGTNATHFSPQGGLRISADELAEYALMYANGGVCNGNQILSSESIDEMLTPVWTWNGKEKGTNGDAEYGLFACYGAGIHLITNGKYNDGYGDVFVEGKEMNLVGHYGDAYGEFSIFMIDPEEKYGFVYICNGTECDYYNEPSYGKYSENWVWEEETVTALDKFIFSNDDFEPQTK